MEVISSDKIHAKIVLTPTISFDGKMFFPYTAKTNVRCTEITYYRIKL
jgi:hypothetical protein